MKIYCLLLICLHFIASEVFAQDSLKSRPRKGALSATFASRGLSLSTDFSLLTDKSFGLKYHYSNSQAIRLSLFFTRPIGIENFFANPGRNIPEAYPHVGSGQISLEMLWYPRLENKVAFFLGGGPSFVISYRDDGLKHSFFKEYTKGLGASCCCGLEYLVHRNICIRGEFIFLAQFKMKYYDDYIDPASDLANSFDFYSFRTTFYETFSRFGISFYF
jgi:hypothetical protein